MIAPAPHINVFTTETTPTPTQTQTPTPSNLLDDISDEDKGCCLGFDNLTLFDSSMVWSDQVNQVEFKSNSYEGVLCWDKEVQGDKTFVPFIVALGDLKFTDGSLEIKISGDLQAGTNFRFSTKTGECFKGNLENKFPVPNVWEEDPTPTPTPTQTPTQTPTPTDTPITLEWKQLGEDIDGEASNDRSGWSVDTNAVGDRVIIGASF